MGNLLAFAFYRPLRTDKPAGSNVYAYDARDQLTSDGVNPCAYTGRGTLSQQTSTAGAPSATTGRLALTDQHTDVIPSPSAPPS